MQYQLRRFSIVILLGLCLLTLTSCTSLLPTRIERNISKIKLSAEWDKIVKHAGINGSQAMLNDLIIRYDGNGTINDFYCKFYVRDSDSRYTYYSAQFNGSNGIKYTCATVDETIADAVKVDQLFQEIDAYGFARLGEGISGDVGLMISTTWGKTNYRSSPGYRVCLLNGGNSEFIAEQTFNLGSEYVAINVWEEGGSSQVRTNLVYIVQSNPEAVPAATAKTADPPVPASRGYLRGRIQ